MSETEHVVFDLGVDALQSSGDASCIKARERLDKLKAVRGDLAKLEGAIVQACKPAETHPDDKQRLHIFAFGGLELYAWQFKPNPTEAEKQLQYEELGFRTKTDFFKRVMQQIGTNNQTSVYASFSACQFYAFNLQQPREQRIHPAPTAAAELCRAMQAAKAKGLEPHEVLRMVADVQSELHKDTVTKTVAQTVTQRIKGDAAATEQEPDIDEAAAGLGVQLATDAIGSPAASAAAAAAAPSSSSAAAAEGGRKRKASPSSSQDSKRQKTGVRNQEPPTAGAASEEQPTPENLAPEEPPGAITDPEATVIEEAPVAAVDAGLMHHALSDPAGAAAESLYPTATRHPVTRGVCDFCLMEDLDLYNVRWGTPSCLAALGDLCPACMIKRMDLPGRRSATQNQHLQHSSRSHSSSHSSSEEDDEDFTPRARSSAALHATRSSRQEQAKGQDALVAQVEADPVAPAAAAAHATRQALGPDRVVAEGAAAVARLLEARVLQGYLSQDGNLLAALNALTPTRSWLAMSPYSKLLLMLKAAACCLPQEQTCWGGRLPACLPDDIAQDLEWPLRNMLTTAQAVFPHSEDRIWQIYQQLLNFTEQLLNGRAVSWPHTSTEVGGFVDTLVSSCWEQLQSWVGVQCDGQEPAMSPPGAGLGASVDCEAHTTGLDSSAGLSAAAPAVRADPMQDEATGAELTADAACGHPGFPAAAVAVAAVAAVTAAASVESSPRRCVSSSGPGVDQAGAHATREEPAHTAHMDADGPAFSNRSGSPASELFKEPMTCNKEAFSPPYSHRSSSPESEQYKEEGVPRASREEWTHAGRYNNRWVKATAGKLSDREAEEIEAYIAKDPVRAFQEIYTTLCDSRMYSEDHKAVCLGSLLRLISLSAALLDEESIFEGPHFGDICVPLKVPDALKNMQLGQGWQQTSLQGLFGDMYDTHSVHYACTRGGGFKRQQQILRPYRAVLFPDPGQPDKNCSPKQLARS